MRKLLFIAVFILSILSVSSQQYFELRSTGFVDIKDSTKNYVVITYEGKTQQQLFDLFLSKLTTMYVSAKNVLSTAGNSTITVNGFSNKTVSFNGAYNYDLNYTIVFLFKDGKVRIDGMNLNRIDGTFGQVTNHKELFLVGNGGSTFFGSQYIFNKKGELKNKKAKEQLENFFNEKIDILKTSVTNKDKDNW